MRFSLGNLHTMLSLLPPLSRRSPGLVVVVTGASSGIGRATALLAAQERHHVVLVARGTEELEKVAAACEEAGCASVAVETADINDDESVAGVVAHTLAEHGRIDAVLHCAGIVTYGRTEDTSEDDFASVVGTNLLGSATVARHVIPVLRDQQEGDLVIVGSLLGHIAVPEMTPYVVSKWGVRALARQLKIENNDLPQVRISHVAPGSVDTEIYDNALDSAGMVNSAPPPTISPERAARAVLGQVGSRQSESQTAWINYAMIGAFRVAPAVWDRTVGPLFHLVSRRRAA